MSLFREFGERFEKTKRAFVDGEDAAYVCDSCEEPVAEDYTYCPHCGEETVEPVE
jgi:predicted amidophosphoribosyltransferase